MGDAGHSFSRLPAMEFYGRPTSHEAIAATRPDAECLVFRDRRLTWADVTERTRRLANHLIGAGLGCHTERSALGGHESGQDHLALYLHNGNEYLEAMLGAFKARVAPFNVNYRYVAEELRYLLADSQARRRSSSTRRSRRPWRPCCRRCPTCACICRWPTSRATTCCPAPSGTKTRSAAASPDKPAGRADRRRPLHPLHRRHDRHAQGRAVAQRRRHRRVLRRVATPPTLRATSSPRPTAALRALLAPPFMHGAGHWMAFAPGTWAAPSSSNPSRSVSIPPTSGDSSSASGSTSC